MTAAAPQDVVRRFLGEAELVVEFDRAVGYFGLMALQDHLADLLRRPVDLGTLASLQPRIRQQVEQDLVYVL